MKSRRENRRYRQSGLEDVTLEDIEVWHCPKCGEEEEVIQDIEQLHRQLAYRIAAKAPRLTPGEIRFLRTYLGLSSTDLARRMGVAKETVSRWERVDAPLPMKTPTERLLRLMVFHEVPVDRYPTETLDVTATHAPRAAELRARRERRGWSVEVRARSS